MLSRLLDPAKAPDAIAELTARAEGRYQEQEAESDFEWMSIGGKIASGAVIAAVTTWLITYFIMRKKVKNPPRLGTNGGNPALADGVSADNPHAGGECKTSTPDLEFSEFCTYGEANNKDEDGKPLAMSQFVICDGCRAWIRSSRNNYMHSIEEGP